MSASLAGQRSLLDLLVKEATEGLSAEESAQLTVLMRERPGADRNAMAAHRGGPVDSARFGSVKQMPAALRDQILARSALAKPQEREQCHAVAAAPARAAAKWTLRARAGGRLRHHCFLAVAGWWPRLVGDHAPPVVAQKTPKRRAKSCSPTASTMQVRSRQPAISR